MAEHEPSIGASDDWYTPPEIFDALGLTFDLDPCSPGPGHWVPARKVFTKDVDGLAQPWAGTVFMNPPFGGRNGHVPWLEKFLQHRDGIAIVRAYTSSAWFHEHAVRADTMLFPRGKTKFIPAPDLRRALDKKAAARKQKMTGDKRVGEATWRDAPGHGVVLLGMGEKAIDALRRSGLGLFVDLRKGVADG